MKCKNCGYEFHYCSNCSPERCFDEGFCNDKCWQSSKEFKDRMKKFHSVIEGLTEKQLQSLREVLEDGENYEDFFLDLLAKKETTL
jgi:hypothetical protein